MTLSDDEQRFLAHRRRFVRTWRYVGAALLALVIAFGAWAWHRLPLLANPLAVGERLQAGLIPAGTLELMAAMLPVVVLALLFVCATFVAISFAAFANERKYLAIIDRVPNDGGA